jgi:hypothetical protein
VESVPQNGKVWTLPHGRGSLRFEHARNGHGSDALVDGRRKRDRIRARSSWFPPVWKKSSPRRAFNRHRRVPVTLSFAAQNFGRTLRAERIAGTVAARTEIPSSANPARARVLYEASLDKMTDGDSGTNSDAVE